MKQEARARKKRTSSGLKGANTCESITAASTIINLGKGVLQFENDISANHNSSFLSPSREQINLSHLCSGPHCTLASLESRPIMGADLWSTVAARNWVLHEGEMPMTSAAAAERARARGRDGRERTDGRSKKPTLRRLPSAALCIDVKYSKDRGRYFVATQDLSPGEIS